MAVSFFLDVVGEMILQVLLFLPLYLNSLSLEYPMVNLCLVLISLSWLKLLSLSHEAIGMVGAI